MKIISVVGASPNFMKIAPFIKEIKTYNNSPFTDYRISKRSEDPDLSGPITDYSSLSSLPSLHSPLTSPLTPKIQHILVHTGQHYDDRMSQSFFEQLEIPKADINLGIG